jgi:hypothetical protein
MLIAAKQLVKVVGGVGHIDDGTKNHRFFEAALALQAVGALNGRSALERWATEYASKGMAMERPNGIMPEDGGHDSGYQALGLSYATRYLALATGTRVYGPLYRVIQKGENWELSRVRADGTIDQSGDTRTTGCKERDATGHCKTTFYASIFNALARWSEITGDKYFQRAAYKVWLRNWAMQPGDVLPPPGLHARPHTVASGQWLTVSGAGFQPLETVKVYFGAVDEATIEADQTGSFGGHSPRPNAHFPVPAVSLGTYTIVARGSYGTVRHTQVTVTG